VDFYLSSKLVESTTAQRHYSERLVRANTLLTYQFRDQDPQTSLPRNAFGLEVGQNIYLCGQQLGKFHPHFDDLLGEILRRDPSGVLVAIEDQYSTAKKLLSQRWSGTLPDVLDRVVFVPRQTRSGYVNLIKNADVLLDPPHFGGVNSSYDAFAFGKPVVTLPSDFHRGRYTLGCYRKMNVRDCIAEDRASYVELAVALGTDRSYRQQVEVKIRESSEALFEDPAAVSEHDRIFRDLIAIARNRK
jgi:predicted O-linked N-acetylglucosamine transferase (SPINDLY family)